MRHPSDVLFPGEKPFPVLPAVDHYAGSEKLMRKALQLQNELGPIFDITCDCEDGAHAGAEREHAEMVAALIMSEDNRHGRLAGRRERLASFGDARRRRHRARAVGGGGMTRREIPTRMMFRDPLEILLAATLETALNQLLALDEQSARRRQPLHGKVL